MTNGARINEKRKGGYASHITSDGRYHPAGDSPDKW